MAKTTQIHDGTTKPIVELDTAYPGGHRLETAGTGGGGGGGGAVTVDNAGDVVDGAIVALGTTTDAGVVTDTTGTVIGFLRGNIIKWIALLARIPAALTGGGNFKVAVVETTVAQPVTDNGGSLTVDGTVTVGSSALPTGAATETTVATLVTESNFNTKTGALNESAPASDTASSGLNGRLQRIAQRLTSLIGLFPTALGGTTSANSLPVVLSSDGPFAIQTGAINETAPASDTASSGLNGRLQRIAQRISSLIALLPVALVGGRLDVNAGAIQGTVSTANSSAVALSGGAAFTGTSEDVSNYASIFVSVFADQASAASGLSVQFSADGTNWDHTRAISVTASSGMILSVSPAAKFFRVVYTNGATPNTVFRLQTIYRSVEVTRALSVFTDVNGTLATAAMGQRVFADLLVQDATGNATNRIRSARDLAASPGAGGSFPASGIAVWDATSFRPALADTSGRQVVVGGAAVTTAVAGNPVIMGAGTTAAGGNAQSLWVESATNPHLRVAIYSGTLAATTLVPQPGVVSPVSLNVAANQTTFNGASWDPVRSNSDVTLLTSGSRTTTQTSADITTYNAGALKVILDMTTVTASPSVTVSIEEKDAVSGKYVVLLTGAAITTISTNEYTIDPAVPAVANVSAQKRIARVLRIIITANNANAGIYSAGYKLLPA